MPQVKMSVLPDEGPPTDDLARLEPKHNSPVYKGTGDTDYMCGSCGAVLLKSIDPSRWREIVIRCHCGAMNDANP